MNRIFRIDPKTLCLGFPRYFTLFGSSDGSECCETQPNCGTVFHNSHSILVTAFSSFGKVALFRLFVWLFINLVMRNQTLVSSLASRFSFIELHSGGCQYSQDVRVPVPLKSYLHGCRRMDPWLLLPRILLVLDTLRPRDTVGSEGVAAVCCGFCARSLVS